jgi:hypothetical protein
LPISPIQIALFVFNPRNWEVVEKYSLHVELPPPTNNWGSIMLALFCWKVIKVTCPHLVRKVLEKKPPCPTMKWQKGRREMSI